MIGYLCNLPDAKHKYTKEEQFELADVYLNGEWQAYPERNKNNIIRGAVSFVAVFWGSLPAFIVCAIVWSLHSPDLSLGGIVMISLIHAVLVVLGIVGIINFFITLGNDTESMPDLAEREANAHNQVVASLADELKQTTLDYRSLQAQYNKLYKEHTKYKKLSNDKTNEVRKLKNKVLDKETIIAKLKNGKAKEKEDIDTNGIDALFEEVK